MVNKPYYIGLTVGPEYAAYAVTNESYNLEKFTAEKKKELIEFRLGYTEKGYTNFCRKCRGFTSENSEEVEPAIQTSLIWVLEKKYEKCTGKYNWLY